MVNGEGSRLACVSTDSCRKAKIRSRCLDDVAYNMMDCVLHTG